MKKSAKLVVVLVLVLAGATLAYAGAAPEGYQGVSDVARDPGAFAGKGVQLKGSVAEGSVDRANGTFALVDGATRLAAKWDPSVPFPDAEAGGTIEGKNVIVTGVVTVENGAPVLLAHDMKVGCASKYRAA